MTTRFTLPALVMLLLGLAPAAHALPCTWISGTVGDWEDAANWSCLVVPDGDDDVTMVSGTVTLNVSHTVRDFTQTSGTVGGTGVLTVTRTLSWSSGTMNTDLTLAASGTGTLSGSTHGLGANTTLRLDGDVAWTGGQIRAFGGGAVLDNNAVLTSTTNSSMTYGSVSPVPVFDNGGTFRYDNPNSVTNFFVLNNSGTVEVQQGISIWSEGGTSTGSFDIAAGAKLDFQQNTFDLTAATVTGTGTVDFSGTATLDGTLGGLTGTLEVSGGTLNLNANESVSALNFTSGTINGPGAITVTNVLTWSSGTTNTDLTLAASGTGTLSGSTHGLGANTTLRLDGDVAWTGGQIRAFGGGAVLDNNAVLTSTTNSSMTYGSVSPVPVFDNGGTFRYDNPNSVTNFFVLNNSGTVEVQQGISIWSEGGTSTGSFDIAAGAKLDFQQNTFDLTAATVTGTGTVDFSGTATTLGGTLAGFPGAVEMTGGTLNFNSNLTIGDLLFTSGTINGPGDLTVTNVLTWSSGTMNTDLTLAASGTGTLSGSTHGLGANTTLRLDGDVAWTGGQIRAFGGGAVLDNNAVLTSTTNSSMTYGSVSPVPVFDNGGTFRYDNPNSVTNFFVLDNSGTVEVQQGTSIWREGGSISSTFDIASGAVLDLQQGVFDLTAATFSGAGTVDFSGTMLNVLTNETIPNFDFTGGTINGPGDLTVTNVLTWSSGTMNTDLTLAASGTGTLSGSTHGLGANTTLRLDGDVAWTGGQIRAFGGGAVLDNNAVLTSTTNSSMTYGSVSPVPVFDNGGTFRYDNPNSVTNFFVLDNSGTVEVQQGISIWSEGGANTGSLQIASGAEFELSGSPVFTNAASGVIGGDGTFDDPTPATSFVNEGTFAPGASSGTLAYQGDYDQTAAATTDLAIEIGGSTVGTEYDQLNVTGDVALGGTLSVTILGGYDPAIGESFDVLTWTGTRTGTFAAFQGLTLPGNKRLDPVFSSDRLTLIVVNDGGGNTPPDANDDLFTVLEDETDAVLDVLANDNDGDGDPLTLGIVTGPANGTASVDDNGTPGNLLDDFIAYSPDADFFGADSLVYSVDDGNGGTDSATVRITVDPVNDEPSFTIIANPDQTVLEDAGPQTVPGFVTGFSPGPPNESGQSPTYFLSDSPNLIGALSVDPVSGDLSYTPAPNAFGTATITIFVRDDGGTANGGDNQSPSQTFQITLLPVNDPPTFNLAGNQSVAEDAGPQSVPNFAFNISAGPGGETGQSVTFTVTNDNNALFSSQPAIDASGTLSYTPSGGLTGVATISVVAMDDGGGNDTSAPQTRTITITPSTTGNNPPSITSLTGDQSGDEGDTFAFSASATDPDGDPLTYIWSFGDGSAVQSGIDLTSVSHVYADDGAYTLTLTVDDGQNRVSHTAGLTGEGAGTPSVRPGRSIGGGEARGRATDTATLAVTVTNVPPAITALSGDTTGVENSSFFFIASATDPGADPLTYTWDFGDGSAGQSGVGQSSVSHFYTAPGSFTLTLTVDDGDGGTDSATLDVTVSADPGTLTVSIVPINLPIVIPSAGGEFFFDATARNTTDSTQTFDFWTEALYPDNTVNSPIIGPVTVTLLPGESVTRRLRQNVPGSLIDGRYTYSAVIGSFPGTVLSIGRIQGDKGGASPRVAATLPAVRPFTWEAFYGETRTRVRRGDVWTGDGLASVRTTESDEEADQEAARERSAERHGEPGADVPDADASGTGSPAHAVGLPEAYALHAAYPNPFTTTATVRVDVPEMTDVTVAVYSLLGQRVAVLHDGPADAGTHALRFDARSLASGVYLVRMTADGFAETQRVTVVR